MAGQTSPNNKDGKMRIHAYEAALSPEELIAYNKRRGEKVTTTRRRNKLLDIEIGKLWPDYAPRMLAILEKQMQKAEAGDTKAFNAVWDKVVGKQKNDTKMEITQDMNNNIKIEFVNTTDDDDNNDIIDI